MTREEAGKKIAVARKKLGKKTEGQVRRRRITIEQYKQVEADLKQAVKGGDISQAHADLRLQEMRLSVERSSQEDVMRRIELAVKAGELTPAEAKKKIADLQDELAQRKAAGGQARLEAMIVRIQEAVNSGKMTPEEGHETIDGYKKRFSSQVTAERFVGKEERTSFKERRTKITKEHYKLAEADLKKAVEEGKVTPEDAKLRLLEMKKALAHKQAQEEYRDLLAQIETAVEAGQLTPEQAKKKVEAYKKRQEAYEKQRAEDMKKADGATEAKQKSTFKRRVRERESRR